MKEAVVKNHAAQNNVVKKTAVIPLTPPRDITIYYVTKELINGIQQRVFQGSYLSRRDANAVARTDLLNDLGRGIIVVHKVRKEEDGLLTVEAECPELGGYCFCGRRSVKYW